MTTDTFSVPSDLINETPEETFDRNGIRRSKDGRPYVKVHCGGCDGSGREPGARRGTTRNCATCRGKGNNKEVLYTRATSFVGVLESRQNLEAWQRRITLLGMTVDNTLWAELLTTDPEDRDAVDELADRAFEIGDGHAAAQKGTDLHVLTESADRGQPFPIPASFDDRRDVAAYVKCVTEHKIGFTDFETFVVNDEYKIGGTFDRRATWPGHEKVCGCSAEALIFDLKTGRVDYGQGKMAQQLAVYASSERYDPVSGARSPLDVCRTTGLIMHVPQGTGEAFLYTVDLVEGWQAVDISAAVRRHRRVSRSWMQPVVDAKFLEVSP